MCNQIEALSQDTEVVKQCTKLNTIVVTKRTEGYAHTRFGGTCSPDVTIEDIKNKYYHPVFGGREAWVSGGNWGATMHTD